MCALVSNAVFDLLVLPFTYVDDILAARGCREVGGEVRQLCAKLKKAKFVVSPKSVLSPSIKMDFIGKIFNTDKRLTCNRKGLLE